MIKIILALVVSLSLSACSKTEEREVGEWTPYPGNPVINADEGEWLSTFASALYADNQYHMYYLYDGATNKYEIGHATSSDGKNWSKDDANNPVMTASEPWEGGGVAVPMVWKEGETWYMLYRGHDPDVGSDATGLATSSDGINWVKEPSNPVLEGEAGKWDENGAEIWGVIKVGSVYYTYYEANIKGTGERAIGVATSTDLVTWEKDQYNPVLTRGRFCPFAIKRKDYYYLLVPHYTSGTDYVEIELYRDKNPTFYPLDREFMRVIKSCSTEGWDSHDQDTPCVLTDNIYRDSYSDANNELWMYYAGESNGIWQEGMTIENDIDFALIATP